MTRSIEEAVAGSEQREAAALRQRLRTMLCVFRSVADHMGVHGEEADDSRLELSGRIGAIARVALASAFDGVDLESLVLDELLRHAVRAEVAHVSGSEVRLNVKAAQLMSLAIHELATNAVKFGALSQPSGRMSVTWRFVYTAAPPRLHFEWLETGVRIKDENPGGAGFGFELVEKLIASQLKGEGKVAILPGGVHCTIEIPLGHTTTT